MSFYGWGITDLIMTIKLCNTIYEALTHATGEFRTYHASVHGLSTSLEIVKSWADEPQDTDLKFQPNELDTLRATIPQLQIATDRYLISLESFLNLKERPEGLTWAQWGKKQMEKLLWHMKDRKDIKEQRDTILALHKSIELILANRNQRDHRVIYNKIEGLSSVIEANSDQVTQNIRQIVLESKDEIFQELRTLFLRLALEQNVQPAVITSSPSKTSMEPTNEDAESALKVLGGHILTASADQAFIGDLSLKIDFKVKQAFQAWLKPSSDDGPSCLWLYGEDAKSLSKLLTVVRIKQQLTTINFKCGRFDENGDDVQPDKLLQQLSYYYLYQVLDHIVHRQDKASTPVTIDLPAFEGLDGTPKSTLDALKLTRSLLSHANDSLIWVIDDFERLEGGELSGGLDGEDYQEAMKLLLKFVGLEKADDELETTNHKTMITTKGRPGVLIDALRDEKLIALNTTGLLGGRNKYDFGEEIKSMILS